MNDKQERSSQELASEQLVAVEEETPKKEKCYEIYQRLNLKCDLILNKIANRKKKIS